MVLGEPVLDLVETPRGVEQQGERLPLEADMAREALLAAGRAGGSGATQLRDLLLHRPLVHTEQPGDAEGVLPPYHPARLAAEHGGEVAQGLALALGRVEPVPAQHRLDHEPPHRPRTLDALSDSCRPPATPRSH